jgi:hypothetical protein
MIKLKDLLNEGPKEMVSKIDKIAKKELGNKVFASHFRDNIYLVSPGGFYSSARLRQMAEDLLNVFPPEMLDKPVGDLKPIRVGTGGATEGQIIIRLK